MILLPFVTAALIGSAVLLNYSGRADVQKKDGETLESAEILKTDIEMNQTDFSIRSKLETDSPIDPPQFDFLHRNLAPQSNDPVDSFKDLLEDSQPSSS